MTDEDVSQIKVGKFTAGIIGLKSVLQDMAARVGLKTPNAASCGRTS